MAGEGGQIVADHCKEHCMDHAAHEQLLQRYDTRLNAHGKSIDDMSKCIVKLTILQEEMAKRDVDMDERVTALEKEPATKWNSLVATVITSVVTSLISSIVTAVAILSS